MGCSEVLEEGQSARDATASLIAESVQVGKTIITCVLADTRRTVTSSTTMTEVQKQKILEFAQAVEIKIPLRLQALATTEGVHPLIQGKLHGLAGDVIFVIKDIWNHIRKAEELVSSFGTVAWNAKEGKPKAEWPRTDKRKMGDSDSQDPAKKSGLKKDKSENQRMTKIRFQNPLRNCQNANWANAQDAIRLVVYLQEVLHQTVFNTNWQEIIQC